jgi:hypothetical protein
MTERDELTQHERELFAALPRESTPDPVATDRLLRAMRYDGMLRPSQRFSPAMRVALRIAAGLALFIGGAFAGSRYAMRNSLETALQRRDLTVVDRILLLQRAGSAYVTAADAYANATQQADSTAVEVANQVLRGAASAVVRGSLNTRTANNLLVALQGRDTTSQKTLLWY